MILGIDAFNIKTGGGITHLVEFLKVARPMEQGFSKVILWGSVNTLNKVNDQDWLIKKTNSWLQGGLLKRVFWHIFLQRREAIYHKCSIIFVPGGSSSSGFVPSVTMSRNMLPFEWAEIRRYGFSAFTLKLILLRFSQIQSFNRAQGVIFLTEYAKRKVLKIARLSKKNIIKIPHGINKNFFQDPKSRRSRDFNVKSPCKLVYVSILSPYKHQSVVAEAISILREKGYHLNMSFVGPKDIGWGKLDSTIKRLDPKNLFLSYDGEVPYEDLPKLYSKMDIAVFASSCENLPNILLECMASGLPIACSKNGPMPELLSSAGVYFEPTNPNSIAQALIKLMDSSSLRLKYSVLAYNNARKFSWEKTARTTFKYLAKLAIGK